MLLIFRLFLCFSPALLLGQMMLSVQSVPDFYMPLLDDIYVAGTFNNWTPGDPAYRLTKQPNGTYSIVLNLAPGTYEYKFSRGVWPSAETTASGGFLPNRSLTYAAGQTLPLSIAGWDDLTGNNSGSGNLLVLDSDFLMPQLGRNRRIWVYLPQNYYTSNDDYPVLYMHDGQNVFDQATSFSGEWGVDEAMIQLENNGARKAIVVGIDNGGASRIDEYSPWTHPTYGGGEGDDYMQFLVNTLKPYIDANFRTLPDRLNTGLMGSSLGGLITFYGGLQYQQTFGKLGIFSPSFWFSPATFTFPGQAGHQEPFRVYLLAGEQESQDMVPDMYRVADSLAANGFSPAELFVTTHADGAHSEWYWRREFPDAFEWLFADQNVGLSTPEGSACPLTAYPNPADDWLRFHWEDQQTPVQAVSISDCFGRVFFRENQLPAELDVRAWPTGLYTVSVTTAQGIAALRVLLR